MKNRSKALVAILMAASMMAMTACGSSSSSTADSSAAASTEAAEESTEAATETATEAAAEEATEVEPVTLEVAYMPNYGSLWAVTTGIEKGYFEEEGITVNLTEFQDGPTIIAAMESGSIDIGYIGQGAHKLCIQGHAQIIALSHISNGDAVIGGAGVASLDDLKGKTVAYSSGTSSEDILNLALDKAGLTRDDITAMDLSAENAVTAMLSGSVDAVATWSPNTLKIMEELGDDATELCDNMTFSDSTISLASWIVTPDYAAAEGNDDVILRFTRALYKAMDYAADDHYDEVAQYVANQTKTDYDSVYDQRGDADWLTGTEVAAGAADGTIEGYYQLQQENFLASGAVEAEVPVADYVLFDNMVAAGE